MNAKELQLENFQQILILGPSGSRKSTIASSFPKPMYMFDFDRRFRAIAGKDVDYDYFPINDGFVKAEKQFELMANRNARGELKYKTIHLASITSLIRMFLKIGVDYYDQETSGGFRMPFGSQSLLLTDQPHYKFVHQALWRCIEDYLLPLKCNVIIEGHEQNQRNAEGNVIGRKMLASDSLAEAVPGKFDETWQMSTVNTAGGTQYFVNFRNSLAKTAYRGLPNKVEVTNKEDVFYDEVFLPLLKEGKETGA